MRPGISLSIVVPCRDEVESLPLLCDELARLIETQRYAAEVIVVDDGSTDGTRDLYPALCERHPWLRVLVLKRSFGQTAAVRAGIEAARGDVLVLMDADLQNDPEDVPRLLAKLGEGYDVVSGWRTPRHDGLLARRLPSIVANRLISWISGLSLHDVGCTLKAYHRSALEEIELYGEMHRFIPIYVHWAGGRITEIPVRHRARVFGRSKYGIGRTLKVILDLVTVTFLNGYAQKPIHFFGIPGLVMGLSGFAIGLYLSVQKVAFGAALAGRPALVLAVLMMLMGFMMVMLGVLAEVIIRTYHESRGKPVYRIAAELSGTDDRDPRPVEPAEARIAPSSLPS
jgi:dolichol-phosphate mannosyltransferase